MTIPRKCRIDLATPPEVALRTALEAVEAMPADTRLTNAGQKIVEALDLVGDYVNDQMRYVGLGGTETPEFSLMSITETCGLLVDSGSGGRCVRVRGHDHRCVGEVADPSPPLRPMDD